MHITAPRAIESAVVLKAIESAVVLKAMLTTINIDNCVDDIDNESIASLDRPKLQDEQCEITKRSS